MRRAKLFRDWYHDYRDFVSILGHYSAAAELGGRTKKIFDRYSYI
jgi:hypothetical protein